MRQEAEGKHRKDAKFVSAIDVTKVNEVTAKDVVSKFKKHKEEKADDRNLSTDPA